MTSCRPVLKSWSTFPMQCPAQWPCSPQLGPTALPLQSSCLTASGLMTRSSGLTSFMGKYFNFSHGKNCHLAQLSWLPYTSVRIISLKNYLLGQQGETTVFFLSFLSKNLYLIHVNSQKQDRTMKLYMGTAVAYKWHLGWFRIYDMAGRNVQIKL